MTTDLLQRIIENPLTTIADYYASCLPENKRAVEFINDELQCNEQQATEQRFGFADRTLGKQIPNRRIKEGRQLRDMLVSLGLYKANGRETLRGRVTEPITDNDGNVIGIRGYKIDSSTGGEAVVVVGAEGKQMTTTKLTNDTKQKQETTNEVTSNDISDDLTIEDGQITFVRDDRRYRIRGLEKNSSTLTLKVNLMASRDGLVHLDSLDLVKARSRASFTKAAATELYADVDVVKKDISQLLWKLETLQAERSYCQYLCSEILN